MSDIDLSNLSDFEKRVLHDLSGLIGAAKRFNESLRHSAEQMVLSLARARAKNSAAEVTEALAEQRYRLMLLTQKQAALRYGRGLTGDLRREVRARGLDIPAN